MSARFCIQSKGVANPSISPQYYVSCLGRTNGCDGANAGDAYLKGMFSRGGAVDSSCDPYTGKDASTADEKCNVGVKDTCLRYHNKKNPGFVEQGSVSKDGSKGCHL